MARGHVGGSLRGTTFMVALITGRGGGISWPLRVYVYSLSLPRNYGDWLLGCMVVQGLTWVRGVVSTSTFYQAARDLYRVGLLYRGDFDV